MAYRKKIDYVTLDIGESFENLSDSETDGSDGEWRLTAEKSTSTPSIGGLGSFGYHGVENENENEIENIIVSTNYEGRRRRGVSCPFPRGNKDYRRIKLTYRHPHRLLNEEEDHNYLRKTLAVARLQSRSRTQRRIANNEDIPISIFGDKMSPGMRAVVFKAYLRPMQRREKVEPPDIDTFYQYYMQKSISDILLMASLTKQSRDNLILLTDVVSSKLIFETTSDTMIHLSEKRLNAFQKLVFRTYEETSRELRVMRLRIIRDFLSTHGEDFARICAGDMSIVHMVDNLLTLHRNTSQASRTGKTTAHWYEREFRLLMEISEWVERSLYTIRWCLPNNKPIVVPTSSKPQ